MPAGGVIQPDGRPPQAKGVGKTARRHDLEQPATPGVGNSDMQWGDAQRLEQAQKVAPRPKKQNAATAPQPAPAQQPQQRPAPNIQPPDAIEFIAGRAGGTLDPSMIGVGPSGYDVEAWTPLLREIARDPNASGPLSTSILAQLSNIRNTAASSNVVVIDQNAADDAMQRGFQ